MNFLDIDLLDVLDVFLVSILIYQLYKLVKNTVAIKILIGIGSIYVFWKIVELLHMELLSEILGQFIGVGVLAIIIVFQQEIRKFLLFVGNNSFSSRKGIFNRFQDNNLNKSEKYFEEISESVFSMSKTKTGALIVLQNLTDLSIIKNNGKKIDAELSKELIECIFFKNNPLHDGAMLIDKNIITSVACILPMSDRTDLEHTLGTRHRAALGLSESTDAKIIVVSEETGSVSCTYKGEIQKHITKQKLKDFLLAKENIFSNNLKPNTKK